MRKGLAGDLVKLNNEHLVDVIILSPNLINNPYEFLIDRGDATKRIRISRIVFSGEFFGLGMLLETTLNEILEEFYSRLKKIMGFTSSENYDEKTNREIIRNHVTRVLGGKGIKVLKC